MSASDDTTDAVADAKRLLDAGHEGDDNAVLHALYEHAVDLEAKLAAVTRERDELQEALLDMHEDFRRT